MPAEQQRQSRVRISGNVARIRKLLREHPLEPQAERRDGETLTFDAFASDQAIRSATGLGLQVEILQTPAQIARVREDVHSGNRFADGTVPRGAGKLLE
jgi:hypothetical protein